jgi:hypothetical protein
MAMAHKPEQNTQHALIVVWGKFAQEVGLIAGLEAVHLGQKSYHYSPQAKVLEFLVAILSGAKYLQDISRSAHPLDKDVAAAQAWGQNSWADYSGVSRTLSHLSWAEVHSLVNVLERISQPLIENELKQLQQLGEVIEVDGDLTSISVSNSSRSYPNAAYGHADDEVRLGYQAGVTSFRSPTYGRLWLSVEHLPGNTVSCSQAEALVVAAEKRTGLRPRRRTELLRERIAMAEKDRQPAEKRRDSQQAILEKAQSARSQVESQLQQVKNDPQTKPEHLQILEQRAQRREQAILTAQKCLEKTRRLLQAHLDQEKILQTRLQRFEQENAHNPTPGQICFRLDAGFGSYENMALLIEMGYELSTKLHNHTAVRVLLRWIRPENVWTRVGKNAEMLAWSNLKLDHFPYPLSIGLERFHTGDQKLKHSVLIYFGNTPLTQDLPAWFEEYNGRQIIEAGIKETKQIFYLNRIKVRSEPAIYLQEAMTIFAANFIRWAAVWIRKQAQPEKNSLQIQTLGVKCQVQVLAHSPAKVIHHSEDLLLRFSPTSSLAGKSLRLHAFQSPISSNFLSRFLRFFH